MCAGDISKRSSWVRLSSDTMRCRCGWPANAYMTAAYAGSAYAGGAYERSTYAGSTYTAGAISLTVFIASVTRPRSHFTSSE
ncbi:protein of unknown function [Pararobbsia alpina]